MMDENQIGLSKLKDISEMKHYDLYDEQLQEVQDSIFKKSNKNINFLIIGVACVFLAIVFDGILSVLFIFSGIFCLSYVVFIPRFKTTSTSTETQQIKRNNETTKASVVETQLKNIIPNAVFFPKGGFTLKELAKSCLFSEFDYHYIHNQLIGITSGVTYRMCDVYTIQSEEVKDYKQHSIMIELQAPDMFDLPVLLTQQSTTIFDDIFLYKSTIKLFDYNVKIYEHGRVIGSGKERKVVPAEQFHYSNVLNNSMLELIKDWSKYYLLEMSFVNDSIFIRLWNETFIKKEDITSGILDENHLKILQKSLRQFAKIVPRIHRSAYRSRWDKVN